MNKKIIFLGVYVLLKYMDFKQTGVLDFWDILITFAFCSGILTLHENVTKKTNYSKININTLMIACFIIISCIYSLFFKRYVSGLNLFLILFFLYYKFFIMKRMVS